MLAPIAQGAHRTKNRHTIDRAGGDSVQGCVDVPAGVRGFASLRGPLFVFVHGGPELDCVCVCKEVVSLRWGEPGK